MIACRTSADDSARQLAMRLGKVLADYATANRITIRELAKSIGCNHTTLWRPMEGKSIETSTMAAVMRWLFSEAKK